MSGNFVTITIVPLGISRILRFQFSIFFLKLIFFVILIIFLLQSFILFDYFEVRKKRQAIQVLQKALMQQKIKHRYIRAQMLNYYKNIKYHEEFDRKIRLITDAQKLLTTNQETVLRKEDLAFKPINTKKNLSHSEQQTILSQLQKLEFNTKIRTINYFQLELFMQDNKDRLARIPSIAPVEGYITSGFGNRIDPFTGQVRSHHAIDWANQMYTPIYAPADGVVIATFNNEGYGKFLVVDHGYGIVTRYAHLSEYEVKVGEKVKRGDLIARMGNTGRSTGPHLHYEVLKNDIAVDPEKYIIE